MNLTDDLLATTKTRLELYDDNSCNVVDKKGTPMCTAFMPAGICSVGTNRAMMVGKAVYSLLFVLIAINLLRKPNVYLTLLFTITLAQI